MTAMNHPLFQEHSASERMDRLSPAQKRVLAWACTEFQALRPGRGPAEVTQFFLPLAEMGLDFPQIRALAGKLPAHYPLDHRHVYFDFRLARWMRVLEPPTLRECLEDYFENAPSRAEAMAFIEKECREFFKAHQGKPDWTMVSAE
jgi:hypothetical protein